MRFKRYIKENKRKIEINGDILDRKKAIRIPTAPSSQYFKDKKKYNRKEKHRQKYGRK